MNYQFIILTIVFSFLLSREAIKTKENNSIPIKSKEPKTNMKSKVDKDLVEWSNEDININNSDYQYEMNKLMEQFKNDKDIIIQEFRRKIEPYKNQRDLEMKNIKSLYSEKRKELKKKYGIKRKPKNSDRKKIKNIEKSK